MTTLGVGGGARYFVTARSESEVAGAIGYARDATLDLFILGGGSNVLIADSGFDGFVLKIALRGIDEIVCDEDEIVCIKVGAGEEWDRFVDHCVKNEFAGVECLSGIPGLVGGTPVQNVGAYGQEVAETIREVRCFDRHENCFVTLSNAECGFGYRKSVFNSTKRDRYVVLSVTFVLRRSGEPRIVYRDLVEYFDDRTPSLAETRAAVLAIRRAKSMVIDANDPNSKSAGSFFKNPVVEKARFEAMKREFGSFPHFEAGEMVKIPAAWLIENAGFYKGFVLGEAGISAKHTLALINRGHASAADMLVLKDKICEAVAEKFGFDLVAEPVFVGFDETK